MFDIKVPSLQQQSIHETYGNMPEKNEMGKKGRVETNRSKTTKLNASE